MATRTIVSVVAISVLFVMAVSTLVQGEEYKYGTPQYWKAEARKELKKIADEKNRLLKEEYDRYTIAVQDIYDEALPYPQESEKVSSEVDRFYKNLNNIETQFQEQRKAIHEQYLDLIRIAQEPAGLSGDWYAGGEPPAIPGGHCSISQEGAHLTFHNEHGGSSAGVFVDKKTVTATDWGNLKGNLISDDKRVRKIEWENNTFWWR